MGRCIKKMIRTGLRISIYLSGAKKKKKLIGINLSGPKSSGGGPINGDMGLFGKNVWGRGN